MVTSFHCVHKQREIQAVFVPWRTLCCNRSAPRGGHGQPSLQSPSERSVRRLACACEPSRHEAQVHPRPLCTEPVSISNSDVGWGSVEQEDPMMLSLISDKASHDGLALSVSLHTLINKIRQLGHRLVGLPMVLRVAHAHVPRNCARRVHRVRRPMEGDMINVTLAACVLGVAN